MGFGIDSDGVDVSVSVDQALAGFMAEVNTVVAGLLSRGCRRFAIDIHENGAVVRGDRPVEPDWCVSPETWKQSVKEIVRATR